MAINILKNISYHNTTPRRNSLIQYIVIHYTAGTTSRPGSAYNTCEWFKNPNAGGSADYCVDDASIVQYNPNPNSYYCWSVGGSKYTSMSTSQGGKFYNKCTNWNSISIEMCSNKKDKSNLNGMATDWYFTEETINNAVELTKYLMKKHNIPIERVIMHHHVTGKVCPNPWVVNEAALKGWNDFLARVKNEVPKPDPNERKYTTCKIAINGKIAEYDTIIIQEFNYVAARAFLEALGYEVTFNNEKKRVKVDNKLTLDIPTIIEDNKAYIRLRDAIAFLNNYDNFHYPQDKNICYDNETKTIVIS